MPKGNWPSSPPTLPPQEGEGGRKKEEHQAVDKVAVEIFRNQFEGVVEEMGHAIMRAGHTVFVKETADFSACLVTPGGEGRAAEVFAAHSRIGIWLQVGWPVEDCLKAVGDLREGDICIANDPVSTGGLSTHLPDIF